MRFLLAIILILPITAFSQTDRDSLVNALVSLAKEQVGVPYKYATSEPGISFDCSGFASYVYRSFDLPNSRSSKEYGNLGEVVSLEECLPGDCMIFSGTAPGSTTIGHVGIVISNDENGLKFIHCSSSANHFGVVITDYYESNYPNRFMQVRRLF